MQEDLRKGISQPKIAAKRGIGTASVARISAGKTRESALEEAILRGQVYRPDSLVEILGISKSTIYRYIKGGKVPSIEIDGYRVVPADYVSWVLRSGEWPGRQ
ncbi:helix-turn-helix domain-containing protein [Streptosporangium sp. NPDC020072]|uniref:helix-turn-helix domain-containing protein n=1 Tax=Streptosporangium sp. NPDC020072 TaxID=3154788 RepID=UPI003423EA91